MIQLYKMTNTNYEMNGDAVLHPLKCIFRQALNGVWELSLSNPLDEKYNLITSNAVIKCNIPNQKNQLFRILDVEKTDDKVTATAYPIFLDSKDEVFLFDIRPTDKNGQEALDVLMEGSKYSGQSNIQNINTSYFENKNLIEAINGKNENSFINRWGGEIIYDNYKIIINNKIGADNHVRVQFGFNLQSIKEAIDFSSVATRIIPIAFNGYMLPEKYIDSENINSYPKIFTKTIKYDDIKLKEDATEDEVSYETLEELYAALRNRVSDEYLNNINLPTIAYDIDMIDLSKTTLYSNYKNLTSISLGDTVHCYHKILNIETSARVLEIEYDVITQSINNIKLGSFEKNYFNNVSETINAVDSIINKKYNTVLAEKIEGIIDATMTSLRYQKDIAKKQDVRAILFEDLDSNSSTFGALSIGSLGFQIAKNRTLDNKDWDWRTAATAKGIIADSITSGIIRAITIEGSNINGSSLRFGNADQKYIDVDTVGFVSNGIWSPSGVRFQGSGDVYIQPQGKIDIFNRDAENQLLNRFIMSGGKYNHTNLYNFRNNIVKNYLTMNSSDWSFIRLINNRDDGNEANGLYVDGKNDWLMLFNKSDDNQYSVNEIKASKNNGISLVNKRGPNWTQSEINMGLGGNIDINTNNDINLRCNGSGSPAVKIYAPGGLYVNGQKIA